MIKLKTIAASAAALTLMASSAMGAGKVLRIQSVLPTSADEVVMLKEFGNDVAALTNGSLRIEVLPAGAVVGPRDIMDAVDAGLVEGGFAWTHYWGGKHVAANLFGAPVAGAGVGLDNIAFLSWFQYGGGKELYDRLWDEMGVNVKGFMLQPVGPEALGWFPKPIKSMDDFRQLRFRAPPGMVGAAYADVGVPAVAMGGGDILPALEKGTIDVADPVYRRILLKLSGEALTGQENFGIDPKILDQMALEIGQLVGIGVQVGLVVGGGNLFRGAALQAAGRAEDADAAASSEPQPLHDAFESAMGRADDVADRLRDEAEARGLGGIVRRAETWLAGR